MALIRIFSIQPDSFSHGSKERKRCGGPQNAANGHAGFVDGGLHPTQE
jgi:hypothetical protein